MMCCFVCFPATQIHADAQHILSKDEVRNQRGIFLSGLERYFKELMPDQDIRYANAINASVGYVDFFACQDFSTIPNWEKPILELIKEGHLNEAIDQYEAKDLLTTFQPETLPSVDRYVMLLEMSGTRQNAVKGLKTLETVVQQDQTSVRSMYHLINLAMDLRMLGVAEEYLGEFGRRAKGNPRDEAEVLMMRTSMLSRRNKPNEAVGYGRQALVLYDSLIRVTKDPKYEIINRARLHRALGRVYYRLEEREQSLKNIRACKECYRLESENGNCTFLTERVRALYALAPLSSELNSFFLADSIYAELDGLGSWLLAGTEYQESQFLFNTLRLRGLTSYRVGKFNESQMYFDQASEMLKKMEDLSPGQNLTFQTDLMFNYASLYYQQGDLQKALESNRKVLELILSNKDVDTRKYVNDLCYCHKYIGNCLWAIGWQKYVEAKKKKTKEVMRYYREACESYGESLHYNPRDAESQSKYNLGQLILAGMEKPMEMPKSFNK